MKLNLIFLFVLIGDLSFAQTSQFQPPRPVYDSVGELDWNVENVGVKFIFEQNCDKTIEKQIKNGEILFEKAIIFGVKCSNSFLVKDETLFKQTIHVEGKKNVTRFLDSLYKTMPFRKPHFSHLYKGGYTMSEFISYADGKAAFVELINNTSSLIVLISKKE
jgi:hypothetical protein